MKEASVPTDLRPRVLVGHVIDRLRALPAGSAQTVVTSPPYWGLRSYGTDPQIWGGKATHGHVWVPTPPRRSDQPRQTIAGTGKSPEHRHGTGGFCRCGAWRGELGHEPTPELFVEHLVQVFDEVARVLRTDGTLWLNLGDTYTAHASGVVGEKRWAKSGIRTADHTGHEEAGRFDKRTSGLPEKNLVGIPWRVAFALQARGWWLRSDSIWAKPNPMPESTRDRPTRAHEYVFLLTRRRSYFYDARSAARPLADSTAQRAKYHYPNPADNPRPDSKWGSGNDRAYPVISRAFDRGLRPSTLEEIAQGYEGKATKAYVGTGAQDPSAVKRRIVENARERQARGEPLTSNLRSVWWIPTAPYRGAHFATFPEELVATCLAATAPSAGVCSACGKPRRRSALLGNPVPGCKHDEAATLPALVLDPFAGSGTVLSVARRMGLRSIGIELRESYAQLARARAGQFADLEGYA